MNECGGTQTITPEVGRQEFRGRFFIGLYWLAIALTREFFKRVTRPFRRYQIPSRVRQTSSASILPPSVKRMTGLRLVPASGLVEIGFRLDDVCAVAVRVGEGFGDGEGEAEGDGNGVAAGAVGSGAASVTTTGMSGEDREEEEIL